MGDLNLPELAKDLIINIINIIVLFVIVRALVYKPVIKFLSARTQRIEGAKAEAEKKMQEAEALKVQYDKLLSEGAAVKTAAVAEGESLGKQQAAQIVADAMEKAKKSIADAEVKNKAAYDKMLEDAKDDIAGFALDISRKILAREVNDEDNMKIVEQFIGGK